jgi:hypothetical protein
MIRLRYVVTYIVVRNPPAAIGTYVIEKGRPHLTEVE